MQCFYPRPAFQRYDGDIHFTAKTGMDYARELVLPCGQCIGCRDKRRKDWAIRCMHEAKMHAESSMLTLTYSDEHVPFQGQLVYPHFQKFMKRLVQRVGKPLRYYMCGEYGELLDRPHFHCLLFGHAFYGDRVAIGKTLSGYLYSSALLESVWRYGFCSIGDVTFESAAYVAGYCMKKMTGVKADEHYTRVDGITGEIYQKVPEFSRMSLKPGIGAGWLRAYESDVLNTGVVMVYDRANTVPRYYLKQLEARDGFQKDILDAVRLENARRLSINVNDNSYERQRVKEEVHKAKLKTKRRNSYAF